MVGEPPLPYSAEVSRQEGARLAREELSDPVYERREPGIVELIWTRLMEWVDWLTQRVVVNLPGGWWTLAALLLTLVALLLALRLYLGPTRREHGRTAPLDTVTPLTAADHRTRSERYAREGEYREAVRERMRAISRELEDRAILPPRPGRTATELATEAASALPDHRTALAEGARVFNDVWYGQRHAGAEDHAMVSELDDRLRASGPRATTERTG